jgi:adenylate cyclase
VSDVTVPYDADVLRQQGHKLGVRITAANVIGAAVVFVYLNALPAAGREPVQDVRDLVFYVIAFFVVGGLGAPFAIAHGHRCAHRANGWFRVEPPRIPTAQERDLTLRIPWDQAMSSFAFWIGASAIFGTLIVVRDHNTAAAIRTAVGIILGGLSTCALVYLLVERDMRPEFAVVLRVPGSHRSRTAGIRPRLLVAWVLGSGIPLVALGLAPIGLDAHGRATLGDRLWLFVFVGVIAGGLATWTAARSIAEPLDAIRDAMQRVERDDLDVEVEVDDGGEVGLLQSGFNRMVAGLRDRQRVRDLFGRHVGAEVAHAALEGDGGLVGQRRDVSVLFVDLVGSTALTQTNSPDDVLTLLNAFFETVVSRIGAEGGWVNKFEGDGALCVFGAPADQADHAARALRAARTLRRELLVLSARYPGLDAGIGVSSGAAVAGNIGSAERYEYTVVGDPVNEAARLTDEAKQRLGRVLASENTVERAGSESASWAVADELSLRGRQQPTLAYEPVLTDVGAADEARRS